jgi:hypothetical protein
MPSVVTTRLTKTGQPVMGTTIEVALADGAWERAKVVGKGFGRDGHTMVLLIVEWEDGGRQSLGPPLSPDDWRAI